MYHDKDRPGRLKRAARITAGALLAGLAVWCCAFVLPQRIGHDTDAQASASLKKAVLDAAVQCYAVEGSYPPNLDYLEKSYGVRVNRKKFIVTYSVFASNQLPDVTVLQISG